MKPLKAWALVNPKGTILGGFYRCAIFWTRAGAKQEQTQHPECVIRPVMVTAPKKPK